MSRIRTIVLVLAAFAAPLPGAAQYASAARIVDANGKVLGPVSDFSSPLVSLEVAGEVVPVVVFEDHLQTVRFSQVYFAGAGCVGMAYAKLPQNNSGLYSPMSIVGVNNSLYLGPRSAPQSINYLSTLIPGLPTCQDSPGQATDVVPVNHVLDLTPLYQPPFAIEPFGAVTVPTGRWALAGLALALLAASWTVLRLRA